MKRLLLVSNEKNAGKTSIVIGLVKAAGKKCGYSKPFGDRLVYKKKRLWDYDTTLLAKILNLDEIPEHITIGFDHSKLRFMYNETSIIAKINEVFEKTEINNEVHFIESGFNFFLGTSVFLDPLEIAQQTGSTLLLIMSGNPDEIIDTLAFARKYLHLKNVQGVIINKVRDLEDFKLVQLPEIEKIGFPVLGVLPFLPELSQLSIKQISETVLAKVLAGQNSLNNKVEHIHIGAMTTSLKKRQDLFEQGKTLWITSGDRSDIVLEAIEHNTAGIILSNNILPEANIITLAEQKKIPLLSVSLDTFQAAKLVDDLGPLLTEQDTGLFEKLENLARENIDLKKLFE